MQNTTHGSERLDSKGADGRGSGRSFSSYDLAGSVLFYDFQESYRKTLTVASFVFLRSMTW